MLTDRLDSHKLSQSFRWHKWDCFQLLLYVRSLYPSYKPLPSFEWIYHYHPKERLCPSSLLSDLCQSHLHKRETSIAHLDILELAIGEEGQICLGTAIVEDGCRSVVHMGQRVAAIDSMAMLGDRIVGVWWY